MRPELLLSAAVALVAAAAFVHVGRRIVAREPPAEHRTALHAFAAWWWGNATFALLVGFLLNVLAAFEWTPLRLFVVVRGVAVVVLLGSYCALTYYLAFVLTGRRAALPSSIALYLGIYAFMLYVFGPLRPVGVDVGPWETTLRYDPPPDPAAFALLLVMFSLPQVLGALAYLSLVRRLHDPSARYRVVMVSAGLMCWFVSLFASNLLGDPTLQFVARPGMGLLTALVVLWAYEPPRWARERLGVSRFGADAPSR